MNLKKILVIFYLPSILFAGQPLLTITPITPLPTQIPNNGTTITTIYQVTNNTKNPAVINFKMTTIPGVEQITNSTGTCQNQMTSNNCLLYLIFHGDQTPASISGGPILNTAGASTRPATNQNLNMTTAPSTTQINNQWISVLIEQDPAPSISGTPPHDLATYVSKIKTLAPELTQFHVRITPYPVTPGSPQYQQYIDTVSAIRAAYTQKLIIGFHPDNSMTQDSCLGWGCDASICSIDPQNWGIEQLTCILNASIQTMNILNQELPAGEGFDTFSIEQSYVEPIATCPLPAPPPPQPAACLQQIKACLCPENTETANGTKCPITNSESCPDGVTLASPSVTFGDVLGSYGGSEIYGPTGLDFGYPQYYNLGKTIISDYDALISGGYFPSASTTCISAPYPNHLYVVDVDTPGAYTPEIPCSIPGQPDVANIYTNPSPTSVSPTLAANYLAYIMTQYPPIQESVNTNGAQVFITLSGEPNILGAPGWNLSNLYQLNYNLGINFIYLKQLYPVLFPNGIPPLQYAIWNFASMLDNI